MDRCSVEVASSPPTTPFTTPQPLPSLYKTVKAYPPTATDVQNIVTASGGMMPQTVQITAELESLLGRPVVKPLLLQRSIINLLENTD